MLRPRPPDDARSLPKRLKLIIKDINYVFFVADNSEEGVINFIPVFGRMLWKFLLGSDYLEGAALVLPRNSSSRRKFGATTLASVNSHSIAQQTAMQHTNFTPLT